MARSLLLLCGDGMEGITKCCLIKGDEVCLDNGKTSRKEDRPSPSKRYTVLPAKRKGVYPAWTLLPGLEFRKTHLLLYFFHTYSWFPTGPVTWQPSSRLLRNTCTHVHVHTLLCVLQDKTCHPFLFQINISLPTPTIMSSVE